MAATIECSSCKRTFENSAKRAGRTTKCWCGNAIAFPAHDEFGNRIADPDLESVHTDTTAPRRAGSSSTGVKNFAFGSILIVVGIGLTVGTYKTASTNGGHYYIVYGPVIVGALKCFHGISQMATGE